MLWLTALITSILFLAYGSIPAASDNLRSLQVVDGGCDATSHTAEGKVGDDLTKRQSKFYCNSVVIGYLGVDRSHLLIQFAEKQSNHGNIIGFGGLLDGDILHVSHLYLMRGEPPVNTSDGECQLMQKKGFLSYIVCGAKVDERGERTVAVIAFRPVGQIKLAYNGEAVSQLKQDQKLHSASSKVFDRIFEYTLFDRTLPDGKHPVWVYYEAAGKIVRVEMPSMDMCVVTPNSERDLGVIKSKNYDVIKKGSENWRFGIEIWKAAFAHYMITGAPTVC